MIVDDLIAINSHVIKSSFFLNSTCEVGITFWAIPIQQLGRYKHLDNGFGLNHISTHSTTSEESDVAGLQLCVWISFDFHLQPIDNQVTSFEVTEGDWVSARCNGWHVYRFQIRTTKQCADRAIVENGSGCTTLTAR